MKRQFEILALTLGFLVLLDVLVAGVLALSEKQVSSLRPLQAYFEYGRSVPGKLREWVEHPSTPGNLFGVAWIQDVVSSSETEFSQEDGGNTPVVRSYGMSFVNNIVKAAAERNPGLVYDLHAGPGAPPNFTYALFLDDYENRRAGDVAVLGILSSAVPALAAMSNRTWMFEQPAPFTYPIFRYENDGILSRIDPLVRSSAAEISLADDPIARAAWESQLRKLDAFYSPITFAAPIMDYSPFARLVRRSLAIDFVNRRKRQLQENENVVTRPLGQMVFEFAKKARTEDLLPVVFLIQTKDTSDLDLLALLKPILVAGNIPYLATAEHFDPRDNQGFLADGHYKREVDAIFAAAFLELLRTNEVIP